MHAGVNGCNLRAGVPEFDTPAFAHQWEREARKLIQEGEVDVPCTMSLGTRRILFQVCRAMEARDVLDIGTYTGSSAVTLALAVRSLGRVVSVDIQDVNSYDGHWVQAGRPGSPRDLAERLDVSAFVDFVAMDSVHFLTHTTRTFDFISIDGWHEEEGVFAEIPLAIAKLKPGGLVFLDDVQPDGPPPGIDAIPGPWRAIERLLSGGAQIEVHLLSQTLEGEPIAAAFLTRRDVE